MEQNNSEIQATWRVDSWFPDLSKAQLTNLKAFFDIIIQFNKVLNLVSAKTFPIIDLVHFADSIVTAKSLRAHIPANSTIYDIGSGNGFPGLVYAILYPDWNLVLVDNDSKKGDFLKHAISTLNLKNCTLKIGQVESLPDNSIEIAVTRGFSTIPKAILMLRKQVKKGGVFYHLKSDEWGMEITQIPPQLCSIWETSLLLDYKLPNTSVKFSIIKTLKIG